jgi:hypothetical protein
MMYFLPNDELKMLFIELISGTPNRLSPETRHSNESPGAKQRVSAGISAAWNLMGNSYQAMRPTASANSSSEVTRSAFFGEPRAI